MAIKLTDVGGSGKDALDTRPDPIGVILTDKFGNWEIARRDNYYRGGSGPIMGLKNNSSWLNNLEFEESRSVFNQEEQKQIVRGASWLLYGLDEILDEWGYAGIGIKPGAKFLSTITGRVFDITAAILEAKKNKAPDKKLREICRSASLATGLMSIMEYGIKKSIPSDDVMKEHLERTYQNGMPYRHDTPTESEIRLDFRYPRLSYALKLADVRIPAAAEWQKANKPDDLNEAEFIKEISSLNRPAIYRASINYDSDVHPTWIGDLIGHKLDTERSRFLLEELMAVEDVQKRIESALVSRGGYVDSVVHNLLKDMVKGFGGQESASLSWTVGLVAENIIAAPHRAGRTSQAAVSAEQVWLAANDRFLMAPLISALTDAGCLISSARGGRVTVMAPKAPEVILAATSLAWDHGAFLSIGQSAMLKKRFMIDLPTDRSAFDGPDHDYLIAAANHMGDKKTLWGLDGICDEKTPEKRAKLGRSIIGL